MCVNQMTESNITKYECLSKIARMIAYENINLLHCVYILVHHIVIQNKMVLHFFLKKMKMMHVNKLSYRLIFIN